MMEMSPNTHIDQSSDVRVDVDRCRREVSELRCDSQISPCSITTSVAAGGGLGDPVGLVFETVRTSVYLVSLLGWYQHPQSPIQA